VGLAHVGLLDEVMDYGSPELEQVIDAFDHHVERIFSTVDSSSTT
jgi:hypothetical protein